MTATILIVEDNLRKRAKVRKVLEEISEFQLDISEATNAFDALQWLRDNACDVLILDLNIPRRNNENAVANEGLSLLTKLTRTDSGCPIIPTVIGLTAYKQLKLRATRVFDREGFVIVHYESSSNAWETPVVSTVKRVAARLTKDDDLSSPGQNGVVVPLHGIRTYAFWQKSLADIASREGWICPTQEWWYGRFSLLQFLSPWSRRTKVAWFKDRYTKLLIEEQAVLRDGRYPSIVAHSFGTYILGNALLKFRDIKVGRVILCGSILPKDFPWGALIDNGQVESVLNLVGIEDIWPLCSSWVIPGTGASGTSGFSDSHQLLLQERHNLSHSEFFSELQIRERWFPFLKKKTVRTRRSDQQNIERPVGEHPIAAMILSIVLLFLLLAVVCILCLVLIAGVLSILTWSNLLRNKPNGL